MSSSLHVSRRTVARGAAWSVPLAAVSVAAPSFAASMGGPVASDYGRSCKCPGSNLAFNFRTAITFTTPGDENWTITFTSFTFDGVAQPASLPGPTLLTGGDGTIVVSVGSNSSASKHLVSYTYSATSASGAVVTGSLPSTEFTYRPPSQCDLGAC